MTKVGEGKDLPEKTIIERSRKDLDVVTEKFQNTLQSYETSAADSEKKEHLKAIMDQQLLLIRSAVNEIKRGGMHKQEALLEKHYKAYMQKSSPEGFSALEHDIATLRDYNEIP
jgi:hypothetical protein